uniref:Uncharacterized protein n=1 Tax=Anopheles darlingi TaxID=43151 RepID=A0A2M4D4I5_ANODA
MMVVVTASWGMLKTIGTCRALVAFVCATTTTTPLVHIGTSTQNRTPNQRTKLCQETKGTFRGNRGPCRAVARLVIGGLATFPLGDERRHGGGRKIWQWKSKGN